MVDLSKITKDEKALFLAYDQGLEHGPSDFNDENIDPEKIIEIASSGFFTGVIFQKGIAEKYYEAQLHSKNSSASADKENTNLPSLIIKLNGKTKLQDNTNPVSSLLCTVDEAIKLGAKAVGYTVYLGSTHEEEMLKELGEVVREAHGKDLPVIGWMYSRGEKISDPSAPEIVAYAARIGLEVGCDMVKVFYPGSKEAVEATVAAAGKTKVVFSGGKLQEEDDFLNTAENIMAGGAAGIAVGRNVWQRENSIDIAEKLFDIVFK